MTGNIDTRTVLPWPEINSQYAIRLPNHLSTYQTKGRNNKRNTVEASKIAIPTSMTSSTSSSFVCVICADPLEILSYNCYIN